jgi:hypothetical protein
MEDGATQSFLVITRTTGAWRDRLRGYGVYVDGVHVVDAKNGATVQGSVSPGTHVVHVKVDWVSSPAVTVTILPGESQYLECGPEGEGLWLRPRAGMQPQAGGPDVAPRPQ